ncbi:hypothetical protein [Bacillus mycoides]|uniref:Uncharacterized protein n=1 Tax=Bacillus mycoides TaxID=1405 RepID=A0A1W6AHR3_BACMY|nr:hypothetical protein [Bacillus mycoides]ARJ25315.1 hypothetical protein B7492_29910 [Bacillus mycoides]TKI85443.1 hypothetical protein FC701_10055 [Bacillus mycoides]
MKNIGVMKKNLEINIPDISNLKKCIEDVRKAALTNDNGPEDSTNYHELRGRLEAVRGKLPSIYNDAVYKPFIKSLDELGQEGFINILMSDSERVREAGLILDIAQAILQHGEGYNPQATDSFQELVSDLYDGFLSLGDRAGIKPPDLSVIAPLIKWGNPEFGPYTWPIDATSILGLEVAIVSLPPVNAKKGLLAWSSIGHEVGGHDILHADIGLLAELAESVRTDLNEQNLGHGLSEYWASRIDETASDILGVLNLGPAAAIGLVGYFRGLNAAFTGEEILRNHGSGDDPHPADILRGYLGAYAVGLLEFDQAKEWEKVIESEVDKDLSEIQLDGVIVNIKKAKESAKLVASTIMKKKLISLENHSLNQIQNWRNKDEVIVAHIRPLLTTLGSMSEEYKSGIYAAHVVAAAVTEALSNDDINLIFERMITLLKVMHDSNPSWGPLHVEHPGDIMRHLLYRN